MTLNHEILLAKWLGGGGFDWLSLFQLYYFVLWNYIKLQNCATRD